MSSSMVFESTDRWPSKEGDERIVPPPLSSYGFQKLAVEYFARAAWDQYKLPYTILRPFNCVGIGESRALGDVEIDSGNVKLAMSHVVPDLVQKVLKGQDPLHILGEGDQVRHYTYGGDLARGIVLSLDHPARAERRLQPLDGRRPHRRELAEVIWRKIKGPDVPLRLTSDPGFEYDVQRRVPDVDEGQGGARLRGDHHARRHARRGHPVDRERRQGRHDLDWRFSTKGGRGPPSSYGWSRVRTTLSMRAARQHRSSQHRDLEVRLAADGVHALEVEHRPNSAGVQVHAVANAAALWRWRYGSQAADPRHMRCGGERRERTVNTARTAEEYIASLVEAPTLEALPAVVDTIARPPLNPPQWIQEKFVGSSYETAYREAERFVSRAFEHWPADELSSFKVLDFGSGWGRILRLLLLRLRPEQVWSSDVDLSMTVLVQSTLPGVNATTNAPMPPSMFRSGMFDGVTAFSVFSHLSEDAHRAWAAEFARVLKPGGKVFMTVLEDDFLHTVEAAQAAVRSGEAPGFHPQHRGGHG